MAHPPFLYFTTLKLCFHALHKMNKQNFFEIVDCFTCEQVHFQSTKQGKKYVVIIFGIWGERKRLCAAL